MDNQLKIQSHQSIRCAACDSTYLKIICGQDEPSLHWGRLECGNCGQWIKWLPKPKPQPDLNRGQFIDELLRFNKLTAWERNFLGSIRNRDYLTCKQQKRFQEISKKVTGGRWEKGTGRSPP